MKNYLVIAKNHNGKSYTVEMRAPSLEDCAKQFHKEDTNEILSIILLP